MSPGRFSKRGCGRPRQDRPGHSLAEVPEEIPAHARAPQPDARQPEVEQKAAKYFYVKSTKLVPKGTKAKSEKKKSKEKRKRGADEETQLDIVGIWWIVTNFVFQSGRLTPANGTGCIRFLDFVNRVKTQERRRPRPGQSHRVRLCAERNLGLIIDDAAPNEVLARALLPLLIARFLRRSFSLEGFHD
uniref:Uncharacterized protein n=1 Tax=Rangifer tarandus platyrhynchus TaxID=3082113 RepID=A0ACB0F9I5_RANTA|nr:unnamed protein product [Rangifer tarandus platyrhynchus]